MFRFIFSILFISFSLVGVEPEAIYLTWENSPESSMVVTWIQNHSGFTPFKVRREGEEGWKELSVPAVAIKDVSSMYMYRVKLDDLASDSRFEFLIGSEPKSYYFMTMPKELTRPIRFAVGGDIYDDKIEYVEEINRIISWHDPDFALLGGDIAYSASRVSFLNGEPERLIDFLKSWTKSMVKTDGTLIPLIAAIGNHDVNGRFGRDPSDARLYYQLFAFGGKAYRVVDFGSYLSLCILDSGHTAPVNGAQAKWLDATLGMRRDVPLKYALYHVPAYPSYRSFNESHITAVRENFVPLFEKYGLEAAFENHDHAYKRSRLIRKGKEDPTGVLYMGDGAWGIPNPRNPKTPNEAWYIAKSAQKRYILLVTIDGKERKYEAFDSDGVEFDSYTR